MKLNPPASSSDLETAREIARRLHQRRRRADFERSEARRATRAAEPTPPAFAPRPPAPRATAPVREPLGRPAPAVADEPEPPSWDETEAADTGTVEDHLAGALDDLTGEPRSAEDEPPSEAVAPGADDLPSFDDEEEAESLAEAEPPDMPAIEIEDGAEGGVSPDEMVGAGGGGEASPAEAFEEPLAGSEFDTSPPADSAEEAVAALGPTEELFDEPPPPPSWDDVVESCRDIAGASGAMIIDPAGQVFAARGEWPDPGPDAIAGRLVAMMERTLKDAPTRSVSAPVGGQHLTAWRVPLPEGLVTAAFIADSPLRSEMRSAIDAEIRRGAGA